MQLPGDGQPNIELTLSEAERNYMQPGPPDLARDAGWLALAVLREDVVIDKAWIDMLADLHEEGKDQSRKLPVDHPKVMASHGARVALYGQLGWIEDGLFQGKLLGQEVTDRPADDILPSAPRAWTMMRVLYFYVGKDLLRPVLNCYNLLYRNPITFPYLLADAAREYDVDVPDLLLNHTEVAAKEPTVIKLAKVLRRRLREGETMPKPVRPLLVPRSVYPKDKLTLTVPVGEFSDGLTLSPPEQDFLKEGQVTLERDAGWLELATTMSLSSEGTARPVDQELVDQINKLEFTDSRPERLALFDLFGWTNPNHYLASKIEKINQAMSTLVPTVRNTVQNLRMFYALLGNDLMMPMGVLIDKNHDMLAAKLVALLNEGGNANRTLLERPSFLCAVQLDGIHESLKEQEAAAAARGHVGQLRATAQVSRQIKVATIPPNIQKLIGNFTDGLELNDAERDFTRPGSFTLERDAGWLEIALLRPDVTVDDVWIAKLNTLYEAGLSLKKGPRPDHSGDKARAARRELLQELGWLSANLDHQPAPPENVVLGLHTDEKLPPTDTFISALRMFYAFLGNDLMMPIARRSSIAFRTQQNILDGMSQIVDDTHDPRELLRVYADVFLYDTSKPIDYARIKRRVAEQKLKAATSRPASTAEKKATSRKRTPTVTEGIESDKPDPELAPVEEADPRVQKWEETFAAYDAASPKRQAAIQGIANNIVGGRDMLLRLAPAIISCTQADLNHVSDIAEEFTGTLQAARKIGVYLAFKYPDAKA